MGFFLIARLNHNSSRLQATITFEALEKRSVNDVTKKYLSDYFSYEIGPFNKAGANACGDLGLTGAADYDSALKKLNFYRYLIGLTGHQVTYDSKWDKGQNEAAKSMKLRGTIGHEIGGWPCATNDGILAAQKSNVAYGSFSVAGSIDQYIYESKNNPTANFINGHRRWFLLPQLSTVGFGSFADFNNVRVIDTGRNPNSPSLNVPFVAYPGPGPFPKQLIYNYVTFSLPKNGLQSVASITPKIVVTKGSSKVEIKPTKSELNKENYGDFCYIMYFDAKQVEQLANSDSFNIVYTTDKGQSYSITTKPFDPVASHCLMHNVDPSWKGYCPANSKITTLSQSSAQSTISQIIQSIPANQIGHLYLLGFSLPYQIKLSDLFTKKLVLEGSTNVMQGNGAPYYQKVQFIADTTTIPVKSNLLIASHVQISTSGQNKCRLPQLYIDQDSARQITGLIYVDSLATAAEGGTGMVLKETQLTMDGIPFYYEGQTPTKGIVASFMKFEVLTNPLTVNAGMSSATTIPSIYIQTKSRVSSSALTKKGSWKNIKNPAALVNVLFSDDVTKGNGVGCITPTIPPKPDPTPPKPDPTPDDSQENGKPNPEANSTTNDNSLNYWAVGVPIVAIVIIAGAIAGFVFYSKKKALEEEGVVA